jgi:predicted enzyme related to lactoylglutathione lyase
VQGEPQGVGGGTLMATVTDPDGNVIGLIQKP